MWGGTRVGVDYVHEDMQAGGEKCFITATEMKLEHRQRQYRVCLSHFISLVHSLKKGSIVENTHGCLTARAGKRCHVCYQICLRLLAFSVPYALRFIAFLLKQESLFLFIIKG